MEMNNIELKPEGMQTAVCGSTFPSCSGNTSYKCDHSTTSNKTYLGEDKEEGGRILRKYR